MVQKTVRKYTLQEYSEIKENLTFWLAKIPEERVAAVELLRRQYHGSTIRLQRSARVIQRSQS